MILEETLGMGMGSFLSDMSVEEFGSGERERGREKKGVEFFRSSLSSSFFFSFFSSYR